MIETPRQSVVPCIMRPFTATFFVASLVPVFAFAQHAPLPAASFKARRQEVVSSMEAGSFVVLFTNPERNRNGDVDFRFRPDSNFWYLTGFTEPDAAVILSTKPFTVDGKAVREVLFVNDRNPGAETWTGLRLGPAGAPLVSAIDLALSNHRFKDVLDIVDKAGLKPCRTQLPEGAGGEGLGAMVDAYRKWLGEKETEFGVTGKLNKMRTIKSKEEIALMQRAASASAKGHIAAMKLSKPGIYEFDLQAALEYEFMRGGCEYPAYPCIVGSGPNSCILHYESNRRQAKSGDLVVIDAAGEYQGYAADITRTFPINGKFTPEQKAIYQLVLDAQTAGIAACLSGKPFNSAHQAASKVMGDGLVKLGIIQNASELRRYFFHGASHYLGMEVHDVGGYGNLAPGAVLTVEPGIYIKEGSPCDKKWWNIGVRIEDDILVTSGAPVVLSAAAPKKIDEIEKLMRPAKKK